MPGRIFTQTEAKHTLLKVRLSLYDAYSLAGLIWDKFRKPRSNVSESQSVRIKSLMEQIISEIEVLQTRFTEIIKNEEYSIAYLPDNDEYFDNDEEEWEAYFERIKSEIISMENDKAHPWNKINSNKYSGTGQE
ncbi:MAG: hypothetical protein ABSG15_00745 [FCB group bacterium]|jgi:hypothetical protein